MEAKEFFEWSDKLDLQNEVEVGRRSYVSRYYYGLFHLIVSSFPEMSNYTNLGTHQAVSEFLERGYRGTEHDIKELRKLSYLMRQAKNFRVNADYLIKDPFTIADCESGRGAVEKCVAKLVEIITPQVKETAT